MTAPIETPKLEVIIIKFVVNEITAEVCLRIRQIITKKIQQGWKKIVLHIYPARKVYQCFSQMMFEVRKEAQKNDCVIVIACKSKQIRKVLVGLLNTPDVYADKKTALASFKEESKNANP